MKRLLLGVFMLALFFSSCNKYADDFQALKDQISALQASVTAISTLQQTIATQTATIAALQSSINALPATITSGLAGSFKALADSLAAVGKRVTNISAAVTSIATTGAATKVVVDKLAVDLGAFITAQNGVNADFKQKLIDLQTKLNLAATSQQVQDAQTAIVNLINQQVIALTKAQKASSDSIVHLLTAKILAGDQSTQQALDAYKQWANGLNATNVATLQTIVDKLIAAKTTEDYTKAAVDALTANLALANGKLDILLKSNAMINEDVTIRNHADLIYWSNKIAQQGVIVNGNVSVNTKDITTVADIALLKTTLNNIVAVIGVNPQTVSNIDGWWSWTMWDPISGPIWGTITLDPTPGAPHWVLIVSAKAADVEINNLVFVVGDYTVLLNDVKDEAITTVGGTFKYDYPGMYVSYVTTVGQNLILVDQSVHASPNGTGTINFPNVSVGAFIGDGTPAVPVDGTVTWNSTGTTSIVFGLPADADNTVAGDGQIHWLTANSATSITLGTVAYTAAGIEIDAAVATSILLPAATTSAGPVTIASGTGPLLGTATLVNLSGLQTSGPLTAWVAAACDVQLPVWNSAVAVNIRGDQVLTIPMWQGAAGSTLNAPETLDLTLASYKWLSFNYGGTIPEGSAGTGANPYLKVIQKLTLGHATERVDLSPYTTLTTAIINGASDGDVTKWRTINNNDPTNTALPTAFGVATPGVYSLGNGTTTGNFNLVHLWLTGIMNTVNIGTLPKLTDVSSAGIINSFYLDNAVTLATLTLNHMEFEGSTLGNGGPGSYLSITNNPILASLTTPNLNKLQVLNLVGNSNVAKTTGLSTLNLTGYTLLANAAAMAIDIQIHGNLLSGSGTAPIAQTGTLPYKEATLTCAQLMGLKPYVHAYNTTYGPAGFASLMIDIDLCPTAAMSTIPGLNNTFLLAPAAGIVPAVWSVLDGVAGITTDKEMQLLGTM